MGNPRNWELAKLSEIGKIRVPLKMKDGRRRREKEREECFVFVLFVGYE